MNALQRNLIRELMRKYSSCGTESLIAYVAETNGMLEACKALLQGFSVEKTACRDWLQHECDDLELTSHIFLHEIKNIVKLFVPTQGVDDHYATLGVSSFARPEEIKKAYRALSMKYHPDTASPEHRDNPEQFIAINKAYQALMNGNILGEKENQKDQWRTKRERTVSPEQRKQVVIWLFGLLLVLIVVTVIASMNLKKRAMLAGLQESRGTSFAPVARKAPDKRIEKVGVEESSLSQRNLLSDPSLPENIEQASVKSSSAAIQSESPVAQHTDGVVSAEISGAVKAKEKEKNEPTPVKSLPKGATISLVSPAPEGQTHHVVPKLDSFENLGEIEKTAAHKREGMSVEAIGDYTLKEKEHKLQQADKAEKKTINIAKDERQEKSRDDAAEALKKTAPIAIAEPNNSIVQPEVRALITEVSASDQIGKNNEKEAKVTNEGAIQAVAPQALPAELLSEEEKKIEAKLTLQAKIDRFFEEYIKVYEQRNLVLFSRFFIGSAEENGKPFAAVMPVYLDLFTSANRLSLDLNERTSHIVDDQIVVDGKYKVIIEYSNGEKIIGSGLIQFLLTEGDNGLLIKKMQYEFYTE